MYPYVFDFKDYFTIAGALFTLLLIAFFLIWFFFDPVSYTHLDVYKRQVPAGPGAALLWYREIRAPPG